ncbi:MAG: hypothetical protein JAZ18_15875 [Candidatus Thiodiazotropha endolucinida]|nr:hypothetical protein [Candidatus Thiodiazotropha endolucinida]
MDTRNSFVAALIGLVFVSSSAAWDGTKTATGEQIEVNSYNHQFTGEGEVEYYDYETGTFKSGYLDMYPGGYGELTDYDTGETYEVDMD